MKRALYCLIILSSLALSVALPVTQTKKDSKEDTEKAKENIPENTQDVETMLEYERYLKEVVQALESDPDFRKKLDKADEADIRSGKIAQELEYVNHHVRTKLDEIKRRELERLRSLANKAYELNNEIDREHLKIPQHLDHANEHSFEIEDLRKLIKKTSEDLAEADRQRRAEFKEYEMQKEFEHEMAMKEMNEEQRKKFQQELEQQKQKHKKHEKVHQPGNKAQLEEVWEKQDHMDRQDFNPKTFFMIHDVDGNGFWDETEVKALFVKELDKVYQSGVAEDDMRERAEEMERMREHVFRETDTDHDGLISYQEFLDQTKREEFNKDPEWETVDQQPQYTHEEYLEFERRRKEEINKMIAQGLLPPHPNMPQGYYPGVGEGNIHQQYHSANGYQQLQQPQMHYQNPQQRQHYQQQQYQQQQQQQHFQQQIQYKQQQQPQHYQNQQYPQQQQLRYENKQQQQHYEQPTKLDDNQIYHHVTDTQASNTNVNNIHASQPVPMAPGNNLPNAHDVPMAPGNNLPNAHEDQQLHSNKLTPPNELSQQQSKYPLDTQQAPHITNFANEQQHHQEQNHHNNQQPIVTTTKLSA